MGHIYAAVAGRYGVQVLPETINGVFGAVWKQRRYADDGIESLATSDAKERIWWHGTVQEVFDAAETLQAFEDRFDQFFDELYEGFAQPHTWRLFDDVEPTLDRLAKMGCRLGLVSNWDTRLYRLMKDLQLDRYFELILTSAEAGYLKPHPAIFKQALERLGLPARKVLHVGDSYEDDAVGAQRAGIAVVLIDRRATAGNNSACLHTLTDLLSMALIEE